MVRRSLRLSAFLLSGMLLWPSATAHAAITPNLLARVSATGSLIAGSGVSSVAWLGTGQYEVTFVPIVSGCAYVATTTNIYSQALTVYTAGGHLDGLRGVYVETKNQGGGLTDGAFDLVVDCGLKGMQYAVVGYEANLVRATPGTTLIPLGLGRYNVTFPSAVSKCAFVATVGDPGHDLVFNPAGVYTGSGPNPNTVYVETKNAAGGLSDGIPFHLAVICASTARSHIAVVNDSGIIARGSALTSSFRGSTGNYLVVTHAAVDPSCATVATRGSVGKTVPFTPATVELIPGPANNTRGIQLRELLFFGGGFTNQAFHAAVICR